MSHENAEIVRPVYEALNRRDWDAVFSATHPDFELPIRRMPETGTYRGRGQVQTFLEEAVAAFDNFVLEPDEFFEGGDHVVVFVKVRARIKGGGGDFGPQNGHLWTIRDGMILSLEMFPKPEEALEAAGLSEDARTDS